MTIGNPVSWQTRMTLAQVALLRAQTAPHSPKKKLDMKAPCFWTEQGQPVSAEILLNYIRRHPDGVKRSQVLSHFEIQTKNQREGFSTAIGDLLLANRMDTKQLFEKRPSTHKWWPFKHKVQVDTLYTAR